MSLCLQAGLLMMVISLNVVGRYLKSVFGEVVEVIFDLYFIASSLYHSVFLQLLENEY